MSSRIVAALSIALWIPACAHPVSSKAPGAAERAPDQKAREEWTSPLLRDHPLVGRIWNVDAARFATARELEDAIVKSTFVLLGEKHDNPDHHRLQAAALGVLVTAGRRPAVAFEMIDASMQAVVDRQLAAAPEDAAALATALAWERSGWPSFELYRPIFETALGARLPVVAANISRSEAMESIHSDTPFAKELIDRHRLDEPLPEALQADLVANLVDGHCGHLPEPMVGPMVKIQRLRDAAMTDALMAHGSRDGAVLIAGGGHVRKDRGVPWYLSRSGATGSRLTVGFVEVEAGAAEPKDYAESRGGTELPFDFVWFTPRIDDVDHCKELEKHMKHGGPKEASRQDSPSSGRRVAS